MIILLLSLILINRNLIPFDTGISKAAFGLYLGWICIAIIANVTAWLVSVNWTGWGLSGEFWATAMVLAGAAITLFVLGSFKNPFTGLAVIWALAGIVIARSWPGHSPIIVAAAISALAIAVFSAMITARIFRGI
jgi:hypothetical protein